MRDSKRPVAVVLANSSLGLYRFRAMLISELVDEYDLVASVPDTEFVAELSKLGTQIYRIDFDRRGLNPFKDIRLLFSYVHLLRQAAPDCVITYTIKPNVYGGIACRLCGIRYYCNVTGLGSAFQKSGLLKKLATFLYKIGLKGASAVFFENEANMTELIDLGVLSEPKAVLLPGAGVDLEEFPYCDYPEESDRIRFLFIGRIMKEKGIEELLQAAQELYREGYPIELDVVGSFEEDYSVLFSQCEAEGWLNYYGYQSDVRPFIRSCQCFVLPSWHEGMANTNLECSAMGRPVITSDIPGCREAVQPECTGFLCDPHSPASLKSTMRTFLELDHRSKTIMGCAARKRMEAYFDKREVVSRTVAAIHRGLSDGDER